MLHISKNILVAIELILIYNWISISILIVWFLLRNFFYFLIYFVTSLLLFSFLASMVRLLFNVAIVHLLIFLILYYIFLLLTTLCRTLLNLSLLRRLSTNNLCLSLLHIGFLNLLNVLKAFLLVIRPQLLNYSLLKLLLAIWNVMSFLFGLLPLCVYSHRQDLLLIFISCLDLIIWRLFAL